MLSFQTMFTFFQQKNLSQEPTLETISSVSENYEKDKNTETTKEFIKKSIALASSETLEWRTLYFDQNIPSKNSFFTKKKLIPLYSTKIFKNFFIKQFLICKCLSMRINPKLYLLNNLI